MDVLDDKRAELEQQYPQDPIRASCCDEIKVTLAAMLDRAQDKEWNKFFKWELKNDSLFIKPKSLCETLAIFSKEKNFLPGFEAKALTGKESNAIEYVWDQPFGSKSPSAMVSLEAFFSSLRTALCDNSNSSKGTDPAADGADSIITEKARLIIGGP